MTLELWLRLIAAAVSFLALVVYALRQFIEWTRRNELSRVAENSERGGDCHRDGRQLELGNSRDELAGRRRPPGGDSRSSSVPRAANDTHDKSP
jgi:hypothetical protein